MINSNATVTRLGAIVAETFHIEPPPPDADLIEDGVLDSFQFVELLFQLERQFDLRIELEKLELDDLRTLERIAGVLARNGKAPGAETPARRTELWT